MWGWGGETRRHGARPEGMSEAYERERVLKAWQNRAEIRRLEMKWALEDVKENEFSLFWSISLYFSQSHPRSFLYLLHSLPLPLSLSLPPSHSPPPPLSPPLDSICSSTEKARGWANNSPSELREGGQNHLYLIRLIRHFCATNKVCRGTGHSYQIGGIIFLMGRA